MCTAIREWGASIAVQAACVTALWRVCWACCVCFGMHLWQERSWVRERCVPTWSESTCRTAPDDQTPSDQNAFCSVVGTGGCSRSRLYVAVKLVGKTAGMTHMGGVTHA